MLFKTTVTYKWTDLNDTIITLIYYWQEKKSDLIIMTNMVLVAVQVTAANDSHILKKQLKVH